MFSNLLKWLNGPLASAPARRSSGRAVDQLDALLLEDRILYSVTPLPDGAVDGAAAADLDGAWMPTAGDLACDGLVLPLNEPLSDSLSPQILPPVTEQEGAAGEADLPSVLPPVGLGFESITDETQTETENVEPTFCPLPPAARHELVLVDQSIQNVEELVESLLAEGGPAREFSIVYLDASRDGFSQVDTALSGDVRFDAIHFVTHGDAGMIRLGGSWLDAQSVEQRMQQIEQWSNSLTEDADLLFYGCETALTGSGQEWLGTVQELTGADVAASDDNTGNAASGGDWDLEFQRGSLETASFFQTSQHTSWQGSLATFAVTNTNDSGAGSLRQAILDANSNAGLDSISFNIDTSDPNYNALLGVWRIQPLSDLPAITETALLDGWTQTGFAGNPLIELDGSLAAGSSAGILVQGSDVTIRGFIIHSFIDDGIELAGDFGQGDNNIVQGNWIGINAAGVAAPNGDHGILLTSGAANNIIGGTGANEANVIAGNTQAGIVIRNAGSNGNVVIGNYIGVGTDGVTSIGNGANGIDILDTSTNNRIGGDGAGEGNIIANSGGNGINVQATAGAANSILANSIYTSGGLGIDLNSDGVTANDAGDADAGPNDLQNFPDITAATSGGGMTQITGSLASSATTTYRIEFFASSTADGSGYGEGATYLGSTVVTTDGSGNAVFDVSLSGVTVTAGYAVSATATVDQGGGSYGPTSEFGLASSAVAGNSAPTLNAARSPALNSVLEDAGAPSGAVGTLVSSLVDFAAPAGQVDNVTDPDAGAQLGVAVTSADANGTWYYSVDDGANWNLLGAVSTANARLLAADGGTRLYFSPNAEFNGNLASALTIRAWDQTSGSNGAVADTTTNGGMTAFSANTDSVSLAVTPVNDAPLAADERLSMNFDGIDDYVTAGSSASLQMTNTMTMEAWINPDVSANVNQMIINREGEYELAIFPDGHLQWGFANTTPGWAWHDTGYVVNPGQWTHVAVTYDNGTVTTYANGVAVDVFAGSGSIGDSHAALDELRIGGRQNSPAGKYFDGRIDDVRIWNVARTQVEVSSAMNVELTGAESGLAGYWNFNENSGVTAADSTANGNDGTLVNGPAWYGYRTGEDVAINASVPGVLANDYDVDANMLTAELVTGPANGTLLLNSDGSFTYTPNLNFSGTDSFTYRAFDGTAYSNVATVAILVDPSNDAPTITSDGGGVLAAINVAENSTVVTTVTATDADQPAQALSYSISGGADAARFTIDSSTGELTFLAAPNFEAPTDADANNVYQVTVQVIDGVGGTDTQALSITVTAANEDPIGVTEEYSVSNRETLTVSGPGVLGNDSDPEGDALSAVLVTGPQHGTLTLNADGSFTYVPDANFAGTDSFTYQASDGTNASTPVVVQLTVNSVGGPPPIEPDSDGDSSGDSGDDSPDDGDGPSSQNDGGSDPGGRDNPLRPPTSPVSRERRNDDSSAEVVKLNDAPPRSAHSGADPTIAAEGGFEGVIKGARRVLSAAERVASQSLDFADADSQLMSLALAELRNDVESSAQYFRYLAGSVTLVSAATSAGYALWALRSAHLVTTFLATVPAWRRFDPLPLVSGGIRSKREEGESLAEIAMAMPGTPGTPGNEPGSEQEARS
jgi:VCBS repeat-containing protein